MKPKMAPYSSTRVLKVSGSPRDPKCIHNDIIYILYKVDNLIVWLLFRLKNKSLTTSFV